ncbi:lipid A biosynthesis lauroyl acyltransferase [Aquibium sp. A9E412]|uniref:lipid A biosynthesis lauroyl acyltransferase n=1 Tax=Aquibium sp. A9E412 TaxID=2976767 RepID=UPI0025AF11EB|nr:lipid A biosynthesis lauroyl acyltransferase [Aquibium sp. A9E412]MDN2566797.1 lipid A biosynthesis lauroyl acyltransferase [Aquibium sp. A9E412]
MRHGRLRRFAYRTLRRLKTAEYWLTAQLALAGLRLLRLLPPDRALGLAERLARRFGPWVGRHRVALDNLRHAFPDKSGAEREAIASDMWANMARLSVEYLFLDRLFDFDPAQSAPGRVEVNGIEVFLKVREEARPHIFFTAHLGNFEMLPVAAAAFGLEITALFRPPNNPYIADYVNATRRAKMGPLVASRAGAALELARVLERDGNVGALVDQKFWGGVTTRFFGRDCLTSPLVPKLARHFDCDVYPARCTRLPGGRFRLDVEDRLVLPRGADGVVDVARTAQLLTDVVERWVREDPGQWMWFHKRWKTR